VLGSKVGRRVTVWALNATGTPDTTAGPNLPVQPCTCARPSAAKQSQAADVAYRNKFTRRRVSYHGAPRMLRQAKLELLWCLTGRRKRP
jgi:hypothetical protein